MHTSRPFIVGIAIMVLLGEPGFAAAAEDQPAGFEGARTEALFEVTIPPQLMPLDVGKVNLERQTLDPGFEAAIGVGNESMRSRAAYVYEGELRITPMVDAWLWRGDAAIGQAPEPVGAGEATALATGDLVYLPAVPRERLDPEASVGLMNPGSVPARIVGFHVHEVGGGFGGWPRGMSGTAVAVSSDPGVLRRIEAGDVRFGLSRVVMEPGHTIAFAEDTAMVLAQVESGRVEQHVAGPGGDFSIERPAGSGLLVESVGGVERSWTAIGEEPATLLVLSVDPSAPAPVE